MADLQVVGTPGRSRFSKALPAPPSGLLQVDSGSGSGGIISPFPTGQRGKMNPFPSPRPLATSSKSLPRIPPSSFSNQSAPISESALPAPQAPAPLRITIPKGSSKMPVQIARRPVGSVVRHSGEEKEMDKEQGREKKRESDASVSSIYSVYGRPRSSTGSSYVTKDSSVASDHDDSIPPPPPKDPRRAEPPGKLQSPPGRLHSDSIASSTSMSSRPELWRRRSIKTEHSVNISDLKLTISNGFTVSPTAVNNSSPLARPLPQIPSQLPPSKGIYPGLPGRNIRKPVPARPAPPQPTQTITTISADDMPLTLAKVKSKLQLRKKDGASLAEKDDVPPVPFPSYVDPHSPPDSGIPTPDYLKRDTQLSQDGLRSHPVSPVTPQSPPDTLAHANSGTVQVAKKNNINTSQTRIRPVQETTAIAVGSQSTIRNLKDVQNNVLGHQPEVKFSGGYYENDEGDDHATGKVAAKSSEIAGKPIHSPHAGNLQHLPYVGNTVVLPSYQTPIHSLPSPLPYSQQSNSRPAASFLQTPAAPSQRKGLETAALFQKLPPTHSQEESFESVVSTSLQTSLIQATTLNSKPFQSIHQGPTPKIFGPRDILAGYPDLWHEGPVSPSYPLDITHFKCFTRHQKFRSGSNGTHPIACSICSSKDKGSCFTCNFCYLRCCSSCHELLRWDKTGNPDRKLTVVLKSLDLPFLAEMDD